MPDLMCTDFMEEMIERGKAQESQKHDDADRDYGPASVTQVSQSRPAAELLHEAIGRVQGDQPASVRPSRPA